MTRRPARWVIARRLKAVTDKPSWSGWGVVAGPAAEICAEADGVVIGSALVRRAARR
jgi:tryptophan synthase alpha subunit